MPEEGRSYEGPSPDTIASLCAGWIRSETDSKTSTSVEPAGGRSVSLSGERDAVLSVTISDLTATLTANTVNIVSASAPRLSVGVRVETEAEAIAAELRSLSRDAALVAALRTLANA